MIYDLQRANTLKRAAAWLLDTILLCIAATFAAWVLSAALNYDSYVQQLEARYVYYETEYGVSRNLTQAEVDAMTPEQLANLEAASTAIAQDSDAIHAYNMMIRLVILIVSLSILLATLMLEFAVPMLFGHGQTIGKKVFGIAVIRQDGVRINGVCLFARTILGKFAIETIIPALVGLMLFFGSISEIGWLIVGAIFLIQAFLLFTTRERFTIHDKIATTVTVDFASQLIFDTYDEMIAYKQKAAAEKAAQQSY